MISALAQWSPRRWAVGVLAAVATVLVIAVPTAMIPTPIFGRTVPPTAWSWPVLILTSVLSGLILATYVRAPEVGAPDSGDPTGRRRGALGGLLTFFSVGCPVCNKLALLALGYAGALRWFAPVQPYLAVLGVALLVWALRVRLRGQVMCPVPSRSAVS